MGTLRSLLALVLMDFRFGFFIHVAPEAGKAGTGFFVLEH